MRRILASFLLFLALWLLPLHQVSAASFNSLSIDTEVTIEEDGSQSITHNLSATSQGEDVITLPLLSSQVENIDLTINSQASEYDIAQVKVQRGPFTVELTQLNFNAPAGEWTAEVGYSTTELIGDGELRTFALPAPGYEAETIKESITVNVPLSLGLPAAIGYQANDSSVGSGMQSYEFSFDEVREKSILLDFATTQTYELSWHEELKNNGFWWKTFEVVLAPDTNQQIVRLNEISPKPSSLRLDQDGNILAAYTLGPKRSVKVETSASASVRTVRYALDTSRTAEEVPGTLEEYLRQEGLWLNGSPVAEGSASERLSMLFEEATSQAADTNHDNYFDFINSFVANIRASGLPARVIAGIVTHNGAQQLEDGLKHYWTEVYLPGTGWMTVDPAMNLFYDQFALADGFHIAEFIRGIDSHKPKANSNMVNFESLTQTPDYSDEFKPEISQTKYLLLPGLSFTKTTTSMPPGRVIDGVGYLDAGNAYKLGSLAPLQEVVRWNIASGSASWGASEVGVGFLGVDSVDVVISAESNLSFLPAIILVLLLASGTFIFVKLRKAKNKPIKVSEADEDIQVSAEELLKQPSRSADEQDS